GAGREFANGVALIEAPLAPDEMLAAVKAIERDFGRRAGRRWGARVLDLDLVAWSGGRFTSRRLIIPHARLAGRNFVLGPLSAIAPDWRLIGALTARHLAARLGKRRPR
ncbi:MAG: 2-amino-4-hydroxy-6-hydroxymethyldihydropteridine diphosphokinase, partial [Sphingomonas bacterium]|nr:2-amino-4-hydroxy-6-hydroxymethyldihydropteridine diphosphokinase [Sphingomonas bacterium]